MVYSKRFSKTTRRYKRRSSPQYFSTASKALATAGTALSLAKGIKSLINVETKMYDQNLANTSIGTTATTFTTTSTGLAEGDSSNDRNGDSIKVRSLNLRWHVSNKANTGTSSTFRLIGYVQKQVNYNLLDPIDILQDHTNILSPYERDSTGFQVILDKTFTLSGASDTSGNNTKTGQFVWRPKNFHIKWAETDGAGTAANLKNGLIRFMIMCDGFTTTAPHIDYSSRLRYVDN